MRRFVTLASLMALLACHSGGGSMQSPVASAPGEAPSQSYLAVLDGHAIYPITTPIHVEPAAFPTRQFTVTATGQELAGQQTSRVIMKGRGTWTSETTASGLRMTAVVVYNSVTVDPPEPGRTFPGPLGPVGMTEVLTLTRSGELEKETASTPEGGDKDPAYTEAILAFLPNYRLIAALPQGRVGQGDRLALALAEGQATFHGRPVIVFSGSGQMPSSHGGPRTSTGKLSGFDLLDEGTGMYTYIQFEAVEQDPANGIPAAFQIVLELHME